MNQAFSQRELSSADDEYGYHLILFITLELLIAQIIKHFSNVTNIPYTPMLTLFGILIGVLSEYLGSWGTGIDFASNINPHLFFMIFLPPLIFESSFSMDPHILKTEFWKVLILAGPFLVVHSFIVAVVIKWVLGYDKEFTFAAAVMFGGLISATDPVAVVSLLKSVGASRTLTILIEGESLVNDGTAAVMFLCALDLVKGAHFNALEIFGTFCRLSIGGPAIGIIFGVVSLMWLRRIVDNPVLETNLTIMTAYLVFYTAEFTILEVSGILSLVFLGFFMSRRGRTSISHTSEEHFHNVFQYLSFSAETILFILAGVIIGAKIFVDHQVIGWQDYLKVIALFILLNLIRMGLIFVLLYPFSKMGYGFDWRQSIVLGYSGLRGAVSLILALSVFLEHDFDKTLRYLVLFHTAGVALLSLLINGTTMPFLLKILGLMRMPEIKKKVLKSIVKGYRKEVHVVIDELKSNKNFNKVEWDKLKELACAEKIRNDIFKSRNIRLEASDMVASSVIRRDELVPDIKQYTLNELYIEAKHRYLCALRGIYWEFFENSQCSRSTVELLVESAERAIDHESDRIKDYKFILSYFNSSIFIKSLFKLKKCFLFKWIVKSYLYNKLCFMYDVTVNYVEAHEECLKWIDSIINNQEIIEKIKDEVEEQLKIAENKLYNEIEENFAEVTKAVQHKRGGYFLINRMKTFVEDMVKAGHIESKEAKFFLDHLHVEVRNLELNRLKINFDDVDLDFASHCKIAKLFSRDELDELCSYFKEEIYDSGDLIIKADSSISKVYYISKGIVHEKNGDVNDSEAPKTINRAGDIFGLQFISKNEGISLTNCYAKTVCTVQVFEIEIFRKFIKTVDQEIKIWHYIGPSIIHLFSDHFSKIKDLDPLQLKILLRNSTYLSLEANKKCDLSNGAILFEGELEEAQDLSESNNEDVTQSKRIGSLKAYSFIYPTSTIYIAKSTCKIFVLPEALKETWLFFDQRVFCDVFNIVSNSITSSKYNSISRRGTNSLRNAKSVVGLAKSLTHPNLINPPNQNNDDKYAKIPEHILKLNLRDLESQNTILPKGYMKSKQIRNYDFSNHDPEHSIIKNKEPMIKIKEAINSESSSLEGGPDPYNKAVLNEINRKSESVEIEIEIPSESDSNDEESKGKSSQDESKISSHNF